MRLFIAIEISEETRRTLAALMGRLRQLCPEAKWVRPEVMHVTLKFIGHMGEENLPVIRAALARVHCPQAIDLHFRGLGFFPNEKRPRVFWCGVEASPNTAPLAAEIGAALVALSIGIAPEEREFTPHLTLARLNSHDLHQRGKIPAGMDALTNEARALASADFGSLRTGEFHLFESKLKASGAEYRRIESFRFAQAAT
jgi:2'-5' RNA ligase